MRRRGEEGLYLGVKACAFLNQTRVLINLLPGHLNGRYGSNCLWIELPDGAYVLDLARGIFCTRLRRADPLACA